MVPALFDEADFDLLFPAVPTAVPACKFGPGVGPAVGEQQNMMDHESSTTDDSIDNGGPLTQLWERALFNELDTLLKDVEAHLH